MNPVHYDDDDEMFGIFSESRSRIVLLQARGDGTRISLAHSFLKKSQLMNCRLEASYTVECSSATSGRGKLAGDEGEREKNQVQFRLEYRINVEKS